MKEYRKGRTPGRKLNDNNEITLNKILKSITRYGPRTLQQLRRTCKNHKPTWDSEPENFADYAIRMGWVK